MTIKYKQNTNAITYTLANPERILLHVVNAQGVMGSGIAKEVRERVPLAYENYRYKYANSVEGLQLGTVTDNAECHKGHEASVINLCAQKQYGGGGKRYLNYGALAECFITVNAEYVDNTTEIVVPYLMGCDRAGGDWDIVLEMLEYFFEDVTVCQL